MQPSTILSMSSVDLAQKRVFIRADLNVPVENGVVTSDARIVASLPTIKHALTHAASVTVMSHLGRPKEGQPEAEFSLQPVANRLAELLHPQLAQQSQTEIPLIQDIDACADSSGLSLLENIRFFAGEKANSDDLAKRLAAQCDVFVMDAFGTAHRAHASTHGIAKFAPVACAGLLLEAELAALQDALAKPATPMLAIVGGAKVSTKLEVLDSLATIADQILVGGGIANTFIAAAGYSVGKSLYEPDLIDTAKEIAQKVTIPLPRDVIVATDFAASGVAEVRGIDQVGDDEMILDIGPATASDWAEHLLAAKTILWNGPVGVFEFDQFGEGTRILAEAVGQSGAFAVAGGGDTLAGIDKYEVTAGVSYISTGGGAFLEFVEGKLLPAVEVLAA
ncbi:MAG: phosphoglycerate kinase, partial [Proteobacteria bacterium]|nr:phosphoglycerate kinase [Pseudomonadota bacterium]